MREAQLVNSFTIVPDLADCGTSLCSGQTATAQVTLRGAQGGRIAGRAIRFDVIGTDYAIVTNNPGQPLASSLTVLTDVTGTAAVIIKANVNAPTQAAQMSVTDVTTGLQLVGNFTIVQIHRWVGDHDDCPVHVKITGAFKGICSTGFVTDYYIYGGTPPYRVTSTFPNSITLVNSVVNTNGGFFRAITNGACVDPLTFSILDATGRQTTATLQQRRGYGRRPGGDAGGAGGRSWPLYGPGVHRQDLQLRHLRWHASLQRQRDVGNRHPRKPWPPTAAPLRSAAC